MALLYGRAGRLLALFGGFRPGQWPARWSCNASYPLRHPRWEPAACEVVPSRLLGSNVTYRYGASRVLYPFGFGLSYATFAFSHLKHAASIAPCDPLEVAVTVSNTAKIAASEVVQVYLQWEGASAPTPELQLVGFTKVLVAAGGETTASVVLLPRHFAVLTGASTDRSSFLDCASTVDKEGCHDNMTHHATPPVWEVQPLTFTLYAGGQQPALAGAARTRAPSNVLKSSVKITGEVTPLSQCPGGTPS
jgi:hypothetical protein